MKREIDKLFTSVIIGLLLIVIATVLSACKTQYVPVEVIKTEYRDRIIKDSARQREVVNIRDSVRYKDSTVIVVNQQGDVVKTEVYKWRDRFLNSTHLLEQLQTKYDSLALVKQDSIQVPYPVEKQLTRWQKTKMDLGGIAFGALLLIAVVFLIKIARKFIR